MFDRGRIFVTFRKGIQFVARSDRSLPGAADNCGALLFLYTARRCIQAYPS